MPANERKVIEIIMEEVGGLDERCKGYRSVLREAVADILTAERVHRIKHGNIQQQVTEKCKAVGEYLAGNRQVED